MDISTATSIQVQLRDQANPTNRIYLTGTADPDQDTNPGMGTASWLTGMTGNTNTPGVYDAEVKVTWSGGRVRTFPNGHDPEAPFFTVEIESGIPDPS